MAEVQLVIVEGPNAGREFDIAGAIVAGRGTDVGIVLEDSEASRKHASFSAEGTSVTVEDLGSTNGTYLNGRQLTNSERLKSSDVIRIGDTEYRYQE